MRNVLLPLALAACGGTAASSTSAPADASVDVVDVTVSDASVPDAPTPNFTLAPCDGGSPATDGGACDPSRLRVVHRSVQGCFAVGNICDTVVVHVPAADQPKLPQGFTCSFDLGVATCSFPIPNHTVDGAAVDAACAVTQALPDVTVDCIIYD
jgi:hypothetical protein